MNVGEYARQTVFCQVFLWSLWIKKPPEGDTKGNMDWKAMPEVVPFVMNCLRVLLR